jgi:hypothetical protein
MHFAVLLDTRLEGMHDAGDGNVSRADGEMSLAVVFLGLVVMLWNLYVN